MKPILLAALAALWLPAVAAPPDTTADPADPAAPVPRIAYRSVFQDTPTGVEQDTTDWKKANADVGQFTRGYVDLLKWEAQNPGATGPAGATRPAQASPAAPAGAHKH